MSFRQTQLTLIIDNLAMSMPNKANVYDTVVDAWTKAMIMVENVVSGMPQSVQSGEALLGLCAWHIYPDLCAVEHNTTIVPQGDTLVENGGLVTVGLRKGRGDDGTGISWSMPLSHLRFYGKAVMSHAATGSQSSRIAFDRVVQIAMGSVMSNWESHYSDLDQFAQFLVAFGTSFQSQSSGRWGLMLSQQARIYLGSSAHERLEIARYISLGRRRYVNFLAELEDHPKPCFGLCDPKLYIRFLTPEKKIVALRDLAQFSENPMDFERSIIRLHHSEDENGYQVTEFASLVPQAVCGTSQKTHRRWLIYPSGGVGFISQEFSVIRRSIDIMKLTGEPCRFLGPSTIESDYATHMIWNDESPPQSFQYLTRHSAWADNLMSPNERLHGWQMGHLDHSFVNEVGYRFWYGDGAIAAVYCPDQVLQPTPPIFPIEYVTTGLAQIHTTVSELLEFFGRNRSLPTSKPEESNYFESLFALARAQDLYATIPEAEIDVDVASRPLGRAQWAQADLKSQAPQMSRTIALACVSMFDTGYIDLSIADLKDVLAISSANSLYISQFLFCDPYNYSPRQPLRHVIGTVGGPGLACLLSPRDTLLREPDLETWKLIDHSKFDGKFDNSFTSTSLHLSLTGYEQPLNFRVHGGRDREAFYLEAAVSAYDNGTWVADLDLHHLLQIKGPHPEFQCPHEAEAREYAKFFPTLVSVDNWYEFLDPPASPAIIRARGNWAARLAFAAIRLSQPKNLIIESERICWACAKERYESSGVPDDKLMFLC